MTFTLTLTDESGTAVITEQLNGKEAQQVKQLLNEFFLGE